MEEVVHWNHERHFAKWHSLIVDIMFSCLSLKEGNEDCGSRTKLNFIIPNNFVSNTYPVLHFNAFLFTNHYCKVDHFSKYGLSDSDEEDIPVSDVKKFKPTVHRQEEKLQKEQQKKTEQQLLATEVSAVGS